MGALYRLRPAGAEIALAFAGMLLGVGVAIVVGMLGVLPSEGPLGRAVGFVSGPAITGIGALFYAWAAKQLPPPLVTDRAEPAGLVSVPMPVVQALGWALVGVAAALAGSYALGELMTVLGFPVEEQESIVAITTAGKKGEATVELVMLGLSAVILAPLAEEFLFRGLLFRRIFARVGPIVAYAVSAVAFAAIHGNLAGFVVYMWLGLVFAETLRRTGRLWAAVVVHMGNNAFALSLLLAE